MSVVVVAGGDAVVFAVAAGHQTYHWHAQVRSHTGPGTLNSEDGDKQLQCLGDGDCGGGDCLPGSDPTLGSETCFLVDCRS